MTLSFMALRSHLLDEALDCEMAYSITPPPALLKEPVFTILK